MTSRSTPPRYQGRISNWKDTEGFGFITPNGGGPAVFVHIKAFAGTADGGGRRPAAGDIVTYRLSSNAQGKPRAEQVAFVRQAAGAQGASHGPNGRHDGIRGNRGNGSNGASAATPARALGVASAYFAILLVLVALGRLPLWLAGASLALSALTLAVYAADKAAARQRRWRTAERSLHLLALAGGWPGALLAQALLRHKSAKAPFQSVFWLTVLLHCAGMLWLQSASGTPLR